MFYVKIVLILIISISLGVLDAWVTHKLFRKKVDRDD